jgi:hypothetical protein
LIVVLNDYCSYMRTSIRSLPVSVPRIDTPTEAEMMAIKRRLLIATAAVLVLFGSAGGMAMLASQAAPTAVGLSAEELSALQEHVPTASMVDPGIGAMAHPSQNAWDAVFRATSR